MEQKIDMEALHKTNIVKLGTSHSSFIQITLLHSLFMKVMTSLALSCQSPHVNILSKFLMCRVILLYSSSGLVQLFYKHNHTKYIIDME